MSVADVDGDRVGVSPGVNDGLGRELIAAELGPDFLSGPLVDIPN